MAGVNKCTFLGNVGKKPEMHQMGEGKAAATFSIVVTKRWKDSDKKTQERTTWMDMVCFNQNLVSVLKNYIIAGSPVYVEAEYAEREQEREDKTKFIVHEFIVYSLQLLGGKNEADLDEAEAMNDAPKSEGRE